MSTHAFVGRFPSRKRSNSEPRADVSFILRRVEASRVALIALVTPVLALFRGQEVNGETIGPREPAGTAVILTGLAFYQWGDRWLERRA